jgi:(2Fe-2S) ferredoxin
MQNELRRTIWVRIERRSTQPNRRNRFHELLQASRVFLLQPAWRGGNLLQQRRRQMAAQTYAKDRIGELRLKGVGKVRINKAGCLDRCDEGPVLVVYPEDVWYSYVDNEDIEEIIQEHLIHGRVVDRLRI